MFSFGMSGFIFQQPKLLIPDVIGQDDTIIKHAIQIMSFYRTLIIGAEAFVGRHLVAAEKAVSPVTEIIGTSRNWDCAGVLNITDAKQACEVLSRLQPGVCIHLAVSRPWGGAFQSKKSLES